MNLFEFLLHRVLLLGRIVTGFAIGYVPNFN